MVSNSITLGGIMVRLFVVVMMMVGAISFVSTVVEGSTKVKQKPVNWQPIYGLKIQGGKAFVDANSFFTRTYDQTEFKAASIMITYDAPVTGEINGKTYTFSSLVKAVMIECTTGLTAPMTDMYFKEAMPTRQSLPLTGLDYSNMDVRISSVILPKGSPLHGTLCAISI